MVFVEQHGWGAPPKMGYGAERSQRLRAVPWGGEGNMTLFGFNGRATRNFLILLVSTHYIPFIDRVNLAAVNWGSFRFSFHAFRENVGKTAREELVHRDDVVAKRRETKTAPDVDHNFRLLTNWFDAEEPFTGFDAPQWFNKRQRFGVADRRTDPRIGRQPPPQPFEPPRDISRPLS
jgi:hypothetical protein